MKKARCYLLSGALSCLALVGQNGVQVEIYPQRTITLGYETFDSYSFRAKVAKSGSLDYTYTEPDGTQIRVSSQRRGQPTEIYETPPLPAVHRIFKEFYPNGKLKRKGLYLSRQFRIGKWLECDERGYCSIVDQDAGRGSFGYNGILKTLEDNGYINTRTGEGNWNFTLWFNDYSRRWGVKLQKGTKYKQLLIDADSGKIINEAEYEVRPGNTPVRGYYTSPSE
jgi:antitoxin component YwqK of YwqJK toxin-antitoxin module